MQVSSINDPNISTGKRYILLSGKNDVSDNDLQFREFASYVNNVLNQKGYIKTDETPDLAVFLNYGIGDPQTSYSTYSLPIYGQTGGGQSTFNASTYGSGGYYTTSGSIYTAPTYGVVGNTNLNLRHTTYSRFIVLDAIDFKEYQSNHKIIPVWKTTIYSTGSSGDLRLVFPYLIVAAKPYIGTNTTQAVGVTIYSNDEHVSELKGIQKKPNNSLENSFR